MYAVGEIALLSLIFVTSASSALKIELDSNQPKVSYLTQPLARLQEAT
jgi:hypothetical protein